MLLPKKTTRSPLWKGEGVFCALPHTNTESIHAKLKSHRLVLILFTFGHLEVQLFIRYGHSHEWISTAIIQIPFIPVIDQTFHEYGTRRVLTAFFKIIRRLQERLIQTTDQFCRVIYIEQCLSGTIRVRRISGIPFFSRFVFTVIQQNDAILCQDSGRSTFCLLYTSPSPRDTR